jgi:hypothetical protein
VNFNFAVAIRNAENKRQRTVTNLTEIGRFVLT